MHDSDAFAAWEACADGPGPFDCTKFLVYRQNIPPCRHQGTGFVTSAAPQVNGSCRTCRKACKRHRSLKQR
ncbi:hypothetical protein C4K39_5242 [Pseudomonas sessilinigenes]|nr:hypothetical protein C4K39_5242 [Pseudomonas sessilinigenes]